MKKNLFSIRDTKAEMYFTPWSKSTIGEAERDFSELAKNKETSVGKYPEDFDLFHVGEFDEKTGKITPFDTPRHILKANAVSAAATTPLM